MSKWTHTIFLYLPFGLAWLVLHLTNRGQYTRALLGLLAWGGFSHIALDVVAHGTPLLFPCSMYVFGFAPRRLIEGGLWAYLTDPLFLLEPVLVSGALIDGICRQYRFSPDQRAGLVAAVIGGLILFSIAFVWLLPTTGRP